METQAKTKELTITRTFDAPREMVWKAWINQKYIEKWWAPKGFTNPVCEWDAKKGGKIYIEMKAPDGTIYPMEGEFIEITNPSKIIFTSAAIDNEGAHNFDVLNTITFIEDGNKTRVILHFIFSNFAAEAMKYIGGAETGWNMSLDKLAELLTKI